MVCCPFQATLFGNLSGQELQTMVSTSELQKTSGTVSRRRRSGLAGGEDFQTHPPCAFVPFSFCTS